ncbi:hypothetical protein R6Q59_005956 [Mikania micrantha]
MTHHYIPLLLIVLPLIFNFFDTCIAEHGQKTAGNWLEIASPYDPKVINVGQFAVDEHNRNTNSTMKFDRVIKGYTQIVGGINWRLTIDVEDHTSIKTCEVLVYEQPLHNVKKLVSFKIL